LDLLNIPNTAGARQVTLMINNKRIIVDGFNPTTNTVYEFWGDYWHGNPNKFRSTDMNPTTKKTFGELYQQTLVRRDLIQSAGYKVVDIWELDWKEQYRA
jgi:hypothetical protein